MASLPPYMYLPDELLPKIRISKSMLTESTSRIFASPGGSPRGVFMATFFARTLEVMVDHDRLYLYNLLFALESTGFNG